jgi:hypothetical protein
MDLKTENKIHQAISKSLPSHISTKQNVNHSTLLGLFSQRNKDVTKDTPERAVRKIFCLLYASANAVLTTACWAGVNASMEESLAEIAWSCAGLTSDSSFGRRWLFWIAELVVEFHI